ncbi:MAG: hypothetical protein WA876_05395, partial [Candidatus Acidiferrales bacterium]
SRATRVCAGKDSRYRIPSKGKEVFSLPKITQKELGIADWRESQSPKETGMTVFIYGYIKYSILGSEQRDRETRFCFKCSKRGVFPYPKAPKAYTLQT